MKPILNLDDFGTAVNQIMRVLRKRGIVVERNRINGVTATEEDILFTISGMITIKDVKTDEVG